MEKQIERLKTILCCYFIILIFIIWGASIGIRNKIHKEINSLKQVDTIFVRQIDTIIIIRPFDKKVTLTVYRPTKEECDNDPLITANGTKIDLEKLKRNELKYCAVSQDLLKNFPYESIVYIEGFGEYKVVDIMNENIKNTVDILQDISKPIFKKNQIGIVKL